MSIYFTFSLFLFCNKFTDNTFLGGVFLHCPLLFEKLFLIDYKKKKKRKVISHYCRK